MVHHFNTLIFFLLGFTLALALWQLEMVYVAKDTSWGYNFGGFGDFGWQLWQWRDFWYIIIFLCFIMVFVYLNRHEP